MSVQSRRRSKKRSPSPRFGACCQTRSASLTSSPRVSSEASLAAAHDGSQSVAISLARDSEERGDPAKGLQLLARLVMAAHQDDGPSRGLRGPHEMLDSGIPGDGVAHEEGLDRAGFDRFGDFGGTVCARPVRGDGLQQRLDEPRFVTDPAVAEHLRADARFERLLNPLPPWVRRTVRVDFRGQGRLPRFDVLQERVAREAGSHEDQRLSDFHDAQLREDLVKVDGTGVARREHLAVPGRANRRQFTNSVLPELGENRFFVIQGKEGDEGLLCRSNGFLDPPQLMRLPRLDDGEDVIDRDVQRVMPPEVLRPSTMTPVMRRRSENAWNSTL